MNADTLMVHKGYVSWSAECHSWILIRMYGDGGTYVLLYLLLMPLNKINNKLATEMHQLIN